MPLDVALAVTVMPLNERIETAPFHAVLLSLHRVVPACCIESRRRPSPSAGDPTPTPWCLVPFPSPPSFIALHVRTFSLSCVLRSALLFKPARHRQLCCSRPGNACLAFPVQLPVLVACSTTGWSTQHCTPAFASGGGSPFLCPPEQHAAGVSSAVHQDMGLYALKKCMLGMLRFNTNTAVTAHSTPRWAVVWLNV